MKIQCSCGIKYSFDITPEMSRAPITFVCKSCGVDSSALINQIIAQELGQATPASGTTPSTLGTVPASAPPPTTDPVIIRVNTSSGTAAPLVAVAPPSAPAAARPAALRVSVHKPAAATESAPAVEAPRMCAKHPGQLTGHHCVVCNKPMCPKCMEVFGFVCSALCKGKAETQGLQIPAYGLQKAAVESRRWRRLGLITVIGCLLVFSAGGSWLWYEYSGSLPKRSFTVRFPDAGYSGQCRFVPENQLVSLHLGTLSRHDLKTKKEIWSTVLIDKKKIVEETTAQFEKASAAPFDPDAPRPLTLPELIEYNQNTVARTLHLYVQGENIWVSYVDKLARYDWQTGKSAKEVPFEEATARVVPHGEELLLIAAKSSGSKVTHVNLASGNSRSEDLGGTSSASLATAGNSATKAAPLARPAAPRVGATTNTAARSRNVTTQARLTAPAVKAANANQQRALAELKPPPEPEPPVVSSPPANVPTAPLLPAGSGFVQLLVKPLSTPATAIRNRTQVTLRRFGVPGAEEWTGEVPDNPELFPLKTVHVLVAARSVWVFDKSNKLLWETKLDHDMIGGFRSLLSSETPPWGEGPLVENGDTLYLFDGGELVAFELTTGKSRWRFAGEFISGLHFDDQGMIYINASHEAGTLLQSPDHTDVPEDTVSFIQKINAATGAPVWKAESEGLVRYVSGKFLYTVASQKGDPGENDDIDSTPLINTGFQKIPHVRIKRLDPKNGRVMWEHYHRHTPLDVRFDKNTIALLCKKEIRILKFLSF